MLLNYQTYLPVNIKHKPIEWTRKIPKGLLVFMLNSMLVVVNFIEPFQFSSVQFLRSRPIFLLYEVAWGEYEWRSGRMSVDEFVTTYLRPLTSNWNVLQMCLRQVRNKIKVYSNFKIWAHQKYNTNNSF